MSCAYIMKKISMKKDDRIDFLWDKYILECRLQGYSETTLRNKEYYFSVFYRFLGESGRASLLTKGVCVSFLQIRLKDVNSNSFCSAFLGHTCVHSKHRIQSVPFCRFLELSVTSTSIGQTFLHIPQDIHLLVSHVTLNNAK